MLAHASRQPMPWLIFDVRQNSVEKTRVRLSAEETSASEVQRDFRAAAESAVSIVEQRQAPNKAPEPTPRSVTPRAIVSEIEMKQRNPNRPAARVAPARVVAHL